MQYSLFYLELFTLLPAVSSVPDLCLLLSDAFDTTLDECLSGNNLLHALIIYTLPLTGTEGRMNIWIGE